VLIASATQTVFGAMSDDPYRSQPAKVEVLYYLFGKIYHALLIRDSFGGHSTFGNENVLYSCTKCPVKGAKER
jgi:hypothetical protein